MKLCAIYNVWDDWDLLGWSLASICSVVDGVIVVGSENSNYGEESKIPKLWKKKSFVYVLEPKLHHPVHAETHKRNFGLEKARELDYTHFITMDADELYDPEEFIREKQRFIDNPDLAGLVCRTQVYVKSPTLTIGYDTTLVPFIHKITPRLKHEFNKSYPFAWEGKNLRIDPTRSLNINSGVEWSDITMHHMSYIRKDIRKKIRNSTAKSNLERSTIIEDYRNAKEGYFFRFYQKHLTKVENKFNIPEMQDLSI